MTLLKLNGDKVIGVALNVPSSHQVKEDEVLIDEMPKCQLADDERAYIYYRNNQVEYVIQKRG